MTHQRGDPRRLAGRAGLFLVAANANAGPAVPDAGLVDGLLVILGLALSALALTRIRRHT
ncbi:MAG: hypothetical protein AB1627_16755 [Chloroflexota bacterium]